MKKNSLPRRAASLKDLDDLIGRAARGEQGAIRQFRDVGSAAVPALVKRWHGPIPEGVHGRDFMEKITAAISLASEADAGPLIEYIRNEEKQVDPFLWLATSALGGSRDPRARDTMLTLLEFPAPLIRMAAAEAVIAWKDRRGIAPLLALLRRLRPRELTVYSILSGLHRTPELQVPEMIPVVERFISLPSTLPGSRSVAVSLMAMLQEGSRSPDEVERIDWSGQTITPRLLARGNGARGVRTLILDETKGLNPHALETIAGWKSLEELQLRWQWDRPTIDLTFLSSLTSLKRLDLENLVVVPGSERAIARLRQLESLTVAGTDDDDAILRSARRLKRLETLHLGRASEQGLRGLSSLTRLRDLRIDDVIPGRPPVATLRELTSLEFLSCGRDWGTDQDLEQLATLRNLRYLNLRGARLSPAGLAALARLPQLTYLDLDGVPLGDAGVKPLASLTGLQGLSLRHCGLTDACVKSLRRLKNLRHLIVYKQLSRAARQELTRERPGLAINKEHTLSFVYAQPGAAPETSTKRPSR